MHRSKDWNFRLYFWQNWKQSFPNRTAPKNARFRYGKNGAVFIRCKELSKVSDLILFGIAEREKQQLLQEEMRLLYVAMTRAKQKLFLPLQLGRKEKMIARQLQNKDFSKEFVCRAAVSSANCMAFWIWYVLYCRQDAEF